MASKKGARIDNNPQALNAKITIRRNVLAAIGANAAVFDAFAGTGRMYAEVWKDAGYYTGCDVKPQADSRLMFCADNRRVMRAIDLQRFAIFDLDAYGSPWEQAIIIADRRPVAPGELLGLVLTEGQALSFRYGEIPYAMAPLVGIKPGKGTVVGLSRQSDRLIELALNGLMKRMRCGIEKRWEARVPARTGVIPMRYIGLVLRGARDLR